MANKDKGEVDMTLGGKRYTFKLGTNALIEAQELLSTPTRLVSIDEMRVGLQAGRLKYIQVLLWAGLQKFHAGMTVEDVNDMLDAANEGEIRVLLNGLGLTMVPSPEDVKELKEGVAKKNSRKVRARRGTGGNSSSRLEA